MRYRILILFLFFATIITSCGRSDSPTPAPPAATVTPISPAQVATARPSATPTVLPPTSTASPVIENSPTVTPLPPEPTPSEASPTDAAPTSLATPTPTTPDQTQAAPTPETPPPTQPAPPLACINQAVFVDDLTIPDGTFVNQGEEFVKSWRIKNDGTCSWNDQYTLVFAGGEAMNGPMTSSLPPAAPGESIDISIDLQAPARGGSYTGNWWLNSDSGEYFGVGVPATGKVWAAINVGFISQDGQDSPPASTPLPGSTPQPTTVPAACGAQRDPSYEQRLLALINQERGAQGLPLLTVEPRLEAAAARHSIDMACNDWASHIGSDRSDWYARVSEAGYANYASARENIWNGAPRFGATPEWFYSQMFNSPVHHDNMFYPTVYEIGIVFMLNTSSQEGYFTLVFARP